MSKLIVEMELPQNCFECNFHCVGQFCDGMGYCSAVPPYCDDDCRPCEEKRPSWCPIKGVLPDEHGRLGDLDELAAGCDDPYWCRWLSEIEDAPTIVPAERKDNENN